MPIAKEKNRGYLKIEGAARAFNFDFHGKTVLDIGSSTGGFTEYALEHGAVKVIAVEKGTNQMKIPLRHDPKIELHEKTDFLKFTTKTPIDVIVADISFMSLKPILKHALTMTSNNTKFLVMLKPQFEAAPDQLNKGVVKNERIRRDIIKSFEQWIKSNNLIILNKHDSETHGKKGNIERFYHLALAK